jgi:hypothetical protein
MKARDFRFWQILLQKSFWGDGRKFLEPLMHFARADVGDHIVSSKINHGPSQWR